LKKERDECEEIRAEQERIRKEKLRILKRISDSGVRLQATGFRQAL